jgi:hypothetical protein
MNALSLQFATLLAQQRSYTRSAEIISVSMDALSILTDASGTTPLPDTLRGFATSTHILASALATRSGAALQIDIHSPRRWQHARGLRLASIRPALATRSGDTPYAVNLSSLLHHRRRSVCYVDFSSIGSSTTSPTASIRQRHRLQQAFDNDIAYIKHSTTTLPTTSIRQQHRIQQAFDNIITMIQPPCDSIDRNMQELHLVPSHATCKITTSRQDLSLCPILRIDQTLGGY